MRISDWNSDVCSSDLLLGCALISVRIERSRDAHRWCTAARCLDFARHERILAERLRHRRIREVDISEPLGKLQRGFEAVGEPRAEALAHRDTVDDDFDVMLIFLVERRRLADLVKFAVDADAREAVLLPPRAFLLILALTAAPHGGEGVGEIG